MTREVVMTTAAGEAQRVSVRRWVLPEPSTGMLFVLVVALHWVEHLVQAVQIHALGVAPAKALGAVGALFPGLVRSEWLHLAYNLALLVGLVVLRRLFTNRGWRLWHLAIAGQSWHLFEHLLLFAQAQTGARFFGTDAPSSVLQLFVPRADLHLTYNGAVTLLMLLAAFEPRGSAQRAAPARPETIPLGCQEGDFRLQWRVGATGATVCPQGQRSHNHCTAGYRARWSSRGRVLNRIVKVRH